MNPTAISLFCGAGGCSLGFKKAGYNILYASDIDANAIQTYQKNFPETLAKKESIIGLDFNAVLAEIGLSPGELDILIGGPPCQGFSTAGSRFWKDPRNSLLKNYVDALNIIRPKWFLMENVEGLLTSNGGHYVYEAINAFIDSGYKVRMEKVYLQEYGVPQRRKRVIIVGNRIGHNFVMPEPTIRVYGQIFKNSDVTLHHAIGGLPPASNCKNSTLSYSSSPVDFWEEVLRGDSDKVTDHYFSVPGGVQKQRMAALKPGQTMKDLPEHLHHESFKKRANRRVKDGTPTEKRGGSPSGLKRLMFNEPCLTITAAATREFVHPIYDRPLTIREAARIQTFSDDFQFAGTAGEKIRQIGNAIPPVMARILAEHIKDDYGFDTDSFQSEGGLLGYSLTKANAMSPALQKTDALINSLIKVTSKNLELTF